MNFDLKKFAAEWEPTFTSYEGDKLKVNDYKYLIGHPDCGTMQMWGVYHDPENHDFLFLFPDGKLGHYIKNHRVDDGEDQDMLEEEEIAELLIHRTRAFLYHDFDQGQYCLEKAIFSNNTKASYVRLNELF